MKTDLFTNPEIVPTAVAATIPAAKDKLSDKKSGFVKHRRKVHLLVFLLLVLLIASSVLHAGKSKEYSALQVRLSNAGEKMEIADTYGDSFEKYFPTPSNERWAPVDFPLVDWQDRVSTWLSSIASLTFNYRWGEEITLPIVGQDRLVLKYYPLWVDIEIGHEGHLLHWMETAWSINPAGIEVRGCQIGRSDTGKSLAAECLFALSTFSFLK